MWEPLPLIVYGYAVHPLSPSRRETRISARNRFSTVTEASADEQLMRDVVTLEVGDEVYAFEQYTPHGRENTDGVWYRGYVVCPTRRPPVTWASDPTSAKPPVKSEETQQVFIGIFPASHIYVRDQLSDAEGRLPELARALNGGSAASSQGSNYGRTSPADTYFHWNKDKAAMGMDPVQEVDEDDPYATTRKSFRLGPPPEQANSSRAGLPVYSTSIRSASPAASEANAARPFPPRPSLKSGDDTASGAVQPIIDEIASALREWHSLMFQYLARRDYQLFHIVKDQIEALHLGRRQLLAQTLSAEETANMLQDCVTKLVVGNLIQGLDVIVRHPTYGGLVTVDVEGEIDPRSWVSAIRMYAMQTSLAYLDIAKQDPKLGILRPSFDHSNHNLAPTPAQSAFPEVTLTHRKSRSRTQRMTLQPEKVKTPAEFYHVFLELRAFIASICSPGETVELFFSLYAKLSSQFLTEDFVVVLNHNGVLARDPSSRIRTLFTDLPLGELQQPVYLVCRIVRNGSLKIGHDHSSGVPRRGSEGHPRGDGAMSPLNSAVHLADTFSPASPNGRTQSGTDGQFRRPFGCAVLELTELAKMVEEQTDSAPLKEYTMPIYVPTNEISFATLHQHIINSNNKELERSSRADGVAITVKAMHGELPSVLRENTLLLQTVPRTLLLGFPDAVFPGETRNELYVKLWSGEFSPSSSGSGRLSVTNFGRQLAAPGNNMEITIEVRDHDGSTIPDAILRGSGEPPVTYFHSMVFQRCNEPTFGELFKLQLPSQGIPRWHLFFTIRNRGRSASKSIQDAGDKPFAFAFQPLFPESDTFLEDESHILVLYRAEKLAQLGADSYLAAPSRLSPGQRIEQVFIPPEMTKIAPPIRDVITIRSSLCSTKFTHKPALSRLLSWEKQDQEGLANLLTEFTFIGEGEIVKYLGDIFNSLFGILVSPINQTGPLDLLVFNALVYVLSIVQDRRFKNFQPVLDVYIQEHFSFTLSASHIIHSMNRLLANPTSVDSAQHLRAALKVWHYIFKFVARSREMQRAKELGMGGGATADHLETKFKRELKAHLAEVTRMMATSSPPSIIGTQTIALQHFTSILPELAKVFGILDLVTIVTAFANSVTAVKGKIVIWKLIMYLQIVKGFLFDDPESRPLLIEQVVTWIKPHFGRYDEYSQTHRSDSEAVKDAARVSWLESIRLCVTIIAVMLDKLAQQLVSPAIANDRSAHRREQDNVELLLSLIPRLLESYREIQSPASKGVLDRVSSPSTIKSSVPVTFPESYPFSLVSHWPKDRQVGPVHRDPDGVFYPSLGETGLVFLSLVLLSPTQHILNFFESDLDIEGRDRFVNLISQFFKVATSILENEAFPKTWLNVNVLAHKVLVKMMDPVATILVREFIPPPDSEAPFDESLWKEGFYMLLKLLSSEHLVIEEFSPQKRRAIWRLAGDLRGEGAAILFSIWQALGWSEQQSTVGETATRYGGNQIPLHSLVGHVVNLCLSHHDQLRNNAVQILFSMIVTQFYQDNHFDAIEHELVIKLDSLFMSDSKGDDISRAFFIGQLRHLFDTSDVEEELRATVGHFLESVDMFLELLLSVRALPEGEEFADDRVIATLRLMNFIRRIGRDEIYIKYVHQLVNMHLQAQNYVEAALTLKLHSNLYEWDLNTFVPPMEDLGLPQQSHFHRKETLCLLILQYLGKGKAWENAVDICKELAHQHSEVTFNYTRLSEILKHQATLLEHIMSEQRYYPDYYRVTFYGNFPQAIRDKRFVYRGYDWEKYGAFCERMLNKHPGAQLYKAAGDPPVDIRYGSDQYIQCTAVAPEPNREAPIFTNPDVPLAVRTYHEHCAINLFSSVRQIRKTDKDGEEEVWIEKTYYTTEEAFPTVLRRSEVVGYQVDEISPLDNAIQEIETKTRDLNTLYAKYQTLAKTAQTVSTSALAMALNAAVDMPSNSGVNSYRRTFFGPDYLTRHPDRTEAVEKLRDAVDEHVRVIDSCLKLHGHLCTPEFIPFHEAMQKFFRRNFRDEIRELVVEEDSILPPRPSETVYAPSAYEGSVSRSMSSSGTRPFVIPPLNLGRQLMTPPLPSPASTAQQTSHSNQTPLARHLAQLAKHGINAVSSAPGELTAADSVDSVESPRNSFMNVGINGHRHDMSQAQASAASIVSGGSLTSSIRGRLSRFGSLNFGRRNQQRS